MPIVISTTGLDQYLEGGKGKLKLLVVGQPSSGKTFFASWAPKPIYAACEEGLMSVAHRKVPFGRITSEADMDSFLTLVEAECKKPEAYRQWDTVVIDTLDAYERTIIHHYLRKQRKAAMSGYEDWGYLSATMNGLFGRLALLPMNLIVLVHAKDVKLEGETPEDQIVPRIKGEIRDQITGDFDFVGLIEVEFDLSDGKRVLSRSIQWNPIPKAPWLKSRGADLDPTPLVGTESDFTVIREGIRARLESLTPSVVITEVATADDAVPDNPEGGPVSAPARAVALAKKAAPAPRKAAAAAPAARPVPAVPVAAAPVPAAPKPEVAEVEATEEQAVANVTEILGGTVVEVDGVPVEPTPEPVATTPVDEPVQTELLVSDLTTVESDAGIHVLMRAADGTFLRLAPDSEPEIPENGEVTATCGMPRYPGATPSARGCGKPFNITLEDNRIIACSSPDSPETAERIELVEIAGLKTRTLLHNACYAAHRRAFPPGGNPQ